jgi:hypothetical protein
MYIKKEFNYAGCIFEMAKLDCTNTFEIPLFCIICYIKNAMSYIEESYSYMPKMNFTEIFKATSRDTVW